MSVTKLVLLGTIFGLLGYDAFVAVLHEPTESQVLRDWGHVSTCLPFVAGFLLGHWFLPRQNPSGSAWGNAAILILALGAWDLWWFFTGRTDCPFYRYPGFYAILGVPLGSFLWGQGDGSAPF
jgi:hypothetical protein